ncbi:DNA topoisomerase 2 [Durusdinium trenchii]|uniref:DNA topoisomerase 2 n=1 Tax=Durusdinium trenchii TaxID=1381693 RepID=A0ABP0R5A4_9DINO
MAVASVPLAQIENCVRRRELSESETALRQNISQKGENAYYFAHNRHFEIPEDAKIISGPGLVTGGSPERIKEDCAELIKEERIEWIKDYAWADAGTKVKVYIDCALADSAEAASATFDTRSFLLDIPGEPRRKLKVDKLAADIKPDESKVRVEVAKGRVTVVLAKKCDSLWRSLVLQK